MKRLAAIAVSFSLLLVGCTVRINMGNTPSITGSGTIVTAARDVEEFERIVVHGAAVVNATVEDKTALEIQIDDNLVDIVTTEVKNKTLTISTRQSYSSTKGLKVNLSTPKLIGVDLSGASQITAGPIESDEFNMHVSGVGKTTLNGKVKRLNLDLSGAGNIQASELAAEHTTVHISGAGAGHVQTTESLEAHISGAGKLTYKGNPKRVQKHVSGVGSITPDK